MKTEVVRKYTDRQVSEAYNDWVRAPYHGRENAWNIYCDHRDNLELGSSERGDYKVSLISPRTTELRA